MKEILPGKEQELNGIIPFLKKKTGKNTHDNGTIEDAFYYCFFDLIF